MAQDFFHGATPPSTSGATTLSGQAATGEATAPPPPTASPGRPAFADGIALRPERTQDLAFLAALFRSTALPELALMPVDDATKEALVRMQFTSQTATYRAQFPQARFDIIERHHAPIGRIVVDPGGEAACIVDFALQPESRGNGLGTAILAGVLQQFAQPKRRVLSKVLAHNDASLRMCRRLGFVQAASIPPFLQLEW